MHSARMREVETLLEAAMKIGHPSLVIATNLMMAAAGYAQQPIRDQIIAKEHQELDSLKSGNYEELASLLADDAVFVDAHGAAGKAEVVKNTIEFRLDEYSMKDVLFVPVSSESGLIAYKITEKGTSHGRQFSAQVHVSALWTKRGGQ